MSDGSAMFNGPERLGVMQSLIRKSRRRIFLFTEKQIDCGLSNVLFSLRDVDTILADAPKKIPDCFSGEIISTRK